MKEQSERERLLYLGRHILPDGFRDETDEALRLRVASLLDREQAQGALLTFQAQQEGLVRGNQAGMIFSIDKAIEAVDDYCETIPADDRDLPHVNKIVEVLADVKRAIMEA